MWHSSNLPSGIALSYTASYIAGLTRGYVDECPTFTGQGEKGLMVLGYPSKSFWKHMWPSWDYSFIVNLPKILLLVLGINVFFIFLIYMAVNTRLMKFIKPITDIIQALPIGQPVLLKEKGVLSEIAKNINQTSQSSQLRRKETARVPSGGGGFHQYGSEG